MDYSIHYYSEAVEKEVLALPTTLAARYIVLTTRMVALGSDLGEPHTKALGGGLFELRLKGAEGIARVLYCTQVGRKIYMLHSFIKKTNKISQTDLETGIKHMKEVKDGNAPGDSKKIDETPGSEGGSGKNRKRRRRTT
jgi:phage-related protein